jgi:hypothetical protein
VKSSRPFWLLSTTAVALATAIFALRYQPQTVNVSDLEERRASAKSVTIPAVESKTQTLSNSFAPAAPAQPIRQRMSHHWAAIETTDYKRYAANLRSLGFPKELVHEIIVADVNKLFELREAPLRRKEVPYDAPLAERQTRATDEELDRARQLRDVQIEKQAMLTEILGTYVPRELLTTPTARNYVAYEYALSQLPPEHRDAAQLAIENEWLIDDVKKRLDRPDYVEAFRQIREERNAALKASLPPGEYERFERNSTPAGTELARRVIGMEPTDDEFQAMYRIAWDNWVETGGVYGLWRAVRVPPDQIAAADQKMAGRLSETLGPDRYLDYQMAVNETGQQLRNLSARYDLSREVRGQAFQLQLEADQLSRTSQVGLPNSQSRLQAQSRIADLHRQTQEVLGPTVWQAWMEGKNRRVKLEP